MQTLTLEYDGSSWYGHAADTAATTAANAVCNRCCSVSPQSACDAVGRTHRATATASDISSLPEFRRFGDNTQTMSPKNFIFFATRAPLSCAERRRNSRRTVLEKSGTGTARYCV